MIERNNYYWNRVLVRVCSYLQKTYSNFWSKFHYTILNYVFKNKLQTKHSSLVRNHLVKGLFSWTGIFHFNLWVLFLKKLSDSISLQDLLKQTWLYEYRRNMAIWLYFSTNWWLLKILPLSFLFWVHSEGVIPPAQGTHSTLCGIATGSEVHTAQRREKKGGLSSQIARNSLSREITTIIEELLFLWGIRKECMWAVGSLWSFRVGDAEWLLYDVEKPFLAAQFLNQALTWQVQMGQEKKCELTRFRG